MTNSIDKYLSSLDDAKRAALQQLREAIHAAAPDAEECISYGMPAFRINGTVFAGFRASAKHCSYYPMSGTIVDALKNDLKDFDSSKGTIRFTPDKPLPAALVKKLVKRRLAE